MGFPTPGARRGRDPRGRRPIPPFRDETDPARRLWIIVATGQSVDADQVEQCRGFNTLAISDAYRIAPHARACYSCDKRWWDYHYEPLRASGFAGELWTQDAGAAGAYGLRYIECSRAPGLSTERRIRAGGQVGNSGAQAINLAYLWGARKLVLLGFDFHGTHFFGEHPKPVKVSSVFGQMINSMWPMAYDLKRLGVQVLNCSPISKLPFWPLVPLTTALAGERPPRDLENSLHEDVTNPPGWRV